MARTAPALADSPFVIVERPSETDLVAKYFRGIGNPVRLRILEVLGEGERSVGELASLLREAQPKVSNHLACLRWCGYVTTRREHRTIYYRIADKRVTKIISLARSLLSDNAEHVAACVRIDGETAR